MKKIFPLLLTLTLVIILSACTQNGGPSGPLYGRWHLEHIDADDIADPNPDGNEIFWSFQTGMIQMQVKVAEHTFNTKYGSFRLDDNTLFLEFPDATNNAPQPQTGLSLENTLQVLRLTHKEMTLLYHPDPANPEASLTYYFRKW